MAVQMMKCDGEMGRVNGPDFAYYSGCVDNLTFRLYEVLHSLTGRNITGLTIKELSFGNNR